MSVTGTETLQRVIVSGTALLKIVSHCGKNVPESCEGTLLGLDDGRGALEVSDAFALPSSSLSLQQQQQLLLIQQQQQQQGGGAEEDLANPTSVNPASAAEEVDVAAYHSEMMRLLSDVNCDDNCVGTYRSVSVGSWCNPEVIKQQFRDQEELDYSTGKAKSVLLVYDPFEPYNNTNSISLKAYRLTDAFMEIMRVRTNPDPHVAVHSDAALAQMSMNDIFYQIPVEVSNNLLARSAVGAIAKVLNREDETSTIPFPTSSSLTSKTGIPARLGFSANPYVEKNLSYAIAEIASHRDETSAMQTFQKRLIRQKAEQAKFMASRKAENAMRAERGEEPLPLKDMSLDIFTPLKDESRFNSILVRKQVDIYCSQINEFVAENFEKLFLIAAVQLE